MIPLNIFSRIIPINIQYKLINPSETNFELAKKDFENKKKNYWDPTGQLNLPEIMKNSVEINAQLLKLKENPTQIKKHKFWGIIVGIIGILACGSLLYTGIFGNEIDFPLILICLSWVPYITIIAIYKSLTIDLIKAQIAKENNWLYDPKYNPYKWSTLKNYFPEVFDKGNKNQYVEDQFWGVTQNGLKTTYFTTGKFTYTIEKGSGKHKSSTTFHKHYFAFPLEKELKSRFLLYPENGFSKLKNFFTKKEINTESIEFNKTFAFLYNGQKGDKAMDIVKTLSPVIQEKILKLKNEKGETTILFVQNTIIFLFEGIMLKNIMTNFDENVVIKQEDKDTFTNQLQTLIGISNEMMKYLD